MPTITISGKKPPYSPDDRRDADYINSDKDRVYRRARAEAEVEKQGREGSLRYKVKAARDDERLRARAAREIRAEAEYEKRDREGALRFKVKAARDDERMRARAAREIRAEAEYEKRERESSLRFKVRSARDDERLRSRAARETRVEADYEYRDRERVARVSARAARETERTRDKSYRAARTEAEWEDSNFERKARKLARERRESDRAATKARTIAARSDPETYVERGIAGIGGRGASAVASGEYGDARRAKRRLARIEHRTRAEGGPASRLEAIAEARASIEGAESLASLGGVLGGRALGMAGMIAGGAYEAGKAYFTLPSRLAGVATHLQSIAAPYTDLKYGGADLGRANNFEGSGLVDRFYQNGHVPEWMRRLGLTPQQAMGIATSTGMPYGSAEHARRTVEDLATANRSVGLAGIGTDRLGQSLNLGNTLGVTYRPYADSDLRAQLTGRVADGGAQNNPGGNATYLKMLSDATARGTTLGLDRSQTLGNMEGLFRQAASAGAIRPDASGLSDFYLNMASQGSARGRTGEAQASVQAGYQESIAGLGRGGDAVSASILQSRTAKMGGLPKDRASLARYFGVDEAKLRDFESTPAGRDAVSYMLQAGAAGNSYAFAEYAKPFLNGNTDVYRNLYEDSPLARSLPGYMRPIGAAAAFHMRYTQDAIDSAPGNSVVESARSHAEFYAKWGPAAQRAGDALGVDRNVILGHWAQETGFGANIYDNNPGNIQAGPGYAGRTVVRGDHHRDGTPYQTRFRAYDTPEQYADDYVGVVRRMDPGAVGAGGDAMRFGIGLQNGRYFENPNGAAEIARTAERVRREAALQPRAGVAVNDTGREDSARSVTGGLLTQQGQLGNAVRNATIGGDTGNLMMAMSENVVRSTQSLMGFSGALDMLARRMTEMMQHANGAMFDGAARPGPRADPPPPRIPEALQLHLQ